jgi:hypothetical protein
VTVEDKNGEAVTERRELWFEIESNGDVPEIATCNAFVCAVLMQSMQRGLRLVVHGPVSRRLLEGLEDFQHAYTCWMPSIGARVEIDADQVIEDPPPRPKAIITLSGGIDGAFSYFRHTRRHEIQRPKDIGAVLLAHGFDARLAHTEDFACMRRSVEGLVATDPVETIVVRTNLRDGEFVPNWSHSHGTGLASCLHQFEQDFGTGLIAGDDRYDALILPWGSSPVTNLLLSSGRMSLTYDSAGYSRTEKAKALAGWPAAMRHLSVCHKGPGGEHCCTCEKCIRTMLNFRANGLPLPPFFRQEATVEQIEALNLKTEVQRKFAADVLSWASRNGIEDPGIDALKRAHRRAEQAVARRDPRTKRSEAQMVRLKKEVTELRQSRQATQAKLDALTGSRTWRWTSPLRALARRARRQG